MTQKFSDSEVAEGNSVLQPQNNRFREWCFTINNYTDADLTEVENIECRYICYAPEIGDQGTPHLQGYIVFKSQRWLKAVSKLLKRAHLTPARGSGSDNKRYIQGPYSKNGKEKPLNDKFCERGECPEQGKRSDLVAYHDDIKKGKRGRDLSVDHLAIRAKYPRLEQTLINEEDEHRAREMYDNGIKPEVHVRWGPPGTGKTRFVYETHPDVFEPSIKKNGVHWWSNYRGQDVILLDEFDGQIPIRDFLRLIDRYPFCMETKGGHVWRLATKIYICSNNPPEEWYPAESHQFEKIQRRLTTVEHVMQG